MQQGPSLVIMAAGMGSRYGGVKQIDPVGPSGEIIIDYSIYDAIRAGFEQVVFVVREEIEEALRESVGRRVAERVETAYVHQRFDDLPAGFVPPPGRSKPWGTGHAVRAARHVIDGPFAVINADDFYGAGAFQTLAARLRRAEDRGGVADWCLVGYVLWNTMSEHGYVSRGICTADAKGRLVDIVERTRVQKFGDVARYSEDGGRTWVDIDRTSLVSMNMWGFTPSYLAELERRFPIFLEAHGDDPKAELYLPAVVNDAMADGVARVEVLRTDERWFGMTYREDAETTRAAIRALVERGVYPAELWP